MRRKRIGLECNCNCKLSEQFFGLILLCLNFYLLHILVHCDLLNMLCMSVYDGYVILNMIRMSANQQRHPKCSAT